VGINEESINKFSKLLMRVNGDSLQMGKRHSANVVTEKLFESKANASRHFSELAMKEIDAPVGQREVQDGAGNRDFVACVGYYNRQWAHAVKKKILTTTPPLRRGPEPTVNMVTEELSRAFETQASLDHGWKTTPE